ncbi:hypothetical protein JW887_03285 [Candidatus Dojkabacteria bacterium]|nr:hypothetical protein [Candidatus Dojkabacteria bacterium]
MKELTLDQAIKEAIELNERVEQNGLDTGFTALNDAIKAFEDEGYPVDVLIPQGQEVGLGFSFQSKDFWPIYSDLLRHKLCDPEGELNKLVKSGISTSVGAVLTAIVSALGIAGIALGVMIPIAVIVVNTGIDAFCAATEERITPE